MEHSYTLIGLVALTILSLLFTVGASRNTISSESLGDNPLAPYPGNNLPTDFPPSSSEVNSD